MKAAVFYGKGELKIEDVGKPERKQGEVLVKVSACGICRTDLHYLHGTPTFKKPPIILGHEISGIVEEGDEEFKVGDRVLIPPVFACGKCFFCRTGRGTICTKQKMVGNHIDGGFAEYISVPSSDIFHLPNEIPIEEGCIISDAISTPYHAVVNRARIKPGEKVAVFGCGGLGLAVIQLCALSGANVIGIDIKEEKLKLAKKFGATEVINASDDIAKTIRKMSGGGVDAAIEAIGNPKTIQQAYESVRWGGRVIVVGFTEKDITINAGRMMFREIEIKGSLGCGLRDYPKVIDMAKSGKLKVKEMVTHKFRLEEINKGFELLEKGEESLIRGIVIP
ncbi:MAG: zinc-binding dehydrogenase [Candidatus Thermoplasmatota archaeon]